MVKQQSLAVLVLCNEQRSSALRSLEIRRLRCFETSETEFSVMRRHAKGERKRKVHRIEVSCNGQCLYFKSLNTKHMRRDHSISKNRTL
jgi:hypothetical protein